VPLVFPQDASAVPPRPARLRGLGCNRQPGAALRVCPRAPLQLPLARRCAPEYALQSHLTRFGHHGPLPENHSVPRTRYFHLPATGRDRLSDTFWPLVFLRTGLLETVLLSIADGSDSRGLLLLPQYKFHPQPLPAQVPFLDRGCTPAYSRSACQYAGR